MNGYVRPAMNAITYTALRGRGGRFLCRRDRVERYSRSRRRQGFAVVLRKEQEVGERDGAVEIGIALGIGAGLAVMLGEDEQVGEVDGAVSIHVAGKPEELEMEVAGEVGAGVIADG